MIKIYCDFIFDFLGYFYNRQMTEMAVVWLRLTITVGILYRQCYLQVVGLSNRNCYHDKQFFAYKTRRLRATYGCPVYRYLSILTNIY